MNLSLAAIKMAFAAQLSANGVLVTYTPITGDSFDVIAATGQSLWPAQLSEGVASQFQSRDFIVAFGCLPSSPQIGDKIVWDDGVMVRTYEVTVPSPNLRHYSVDQSNTFYRIHVKLLSEVASS